MIKRLYRKLIYAAVAAMAFAGPVLACDVSDSQRSEASQLSWEKFDQTGGVWGSYRELMKQRCYAEAIEAYRAWLHQNGDFPDERSRGIGMFHIGQALAFTGNIEGARSMISQAMRNVQAEGPRANVWNLYVGGVLGYLNRDIKLIKSARDQLSGYDSDFAKDRVEILDALRRCFREPYHIAMSKRCRR